MRWACFMQGSLLDLIPRHSEGPLTAGQYRREVFLARKCVCQRAVENRTYRRWILICFWGFSGWKTGSGTIVNEFAEISGIYETLWQSALAGFERGEFQTDPHLSGRANDLRRCVTLVLRPAQTVRAQMRALVDRLAAACPGQYYYRPEEFHVTVLSIISGSEHWRHEMRQLAVCRAIIGEVLSRCRAFTIGFRGVTASPGCVMVQGFPAGGGLVRMRDELRAAFAREGIGSLLDRRYKIRTAHATILRFSQPVTDGNRLISVLKEGRQIVFGGSEIQSLELIWGDWYASAGSVRTLQQYRLAAPPE